MEKTFDNIKDLLDIPELQGFEEFLTLLELNEEDFKHLKPLVIEEMEKALSNSNDKLNLALGFNMSGKSINELYQTFYQIRDKIDKTFEQYSLEKRDFLKQIFNLLMNSLVDGIAAGKKIIQIPIELCHKDAKIPTYSNLFDAGCDVYALDDYTIEPKQTTVIPLGFKLAIPSGYYFQICPRSGLSSRTKMRVVIGTIDAPYRGEVGVIIDNISDRPFYINKGQRIAQMVLKEIPRAQFMQVKNIAEYSSSRGEGGFGSSGN